MVKITFLLAFFGMTTLIGIFLMMAGIAASHGHFTFRPHMTQDWFIFGTPIVGVVGLILVSLYWMKRKDD